MNKQVLLISNEIERIIDTLERNSGYTGGIGDIQRAICDKILSFINSLPEEDERIDLEKEINKFLDDTGAPYYWANGDEQMEWMKIVAKYFYELGAKSQKG